MCRTADDERKSSLSPVSLFWSPEPLPSVSAKRILKSQVHLELWVQEVARIPHGVAL